MSNHEQYVSYKCIGCHHNLFVDGKRWKCEQCENSFPIIDGIGIFLPRPNPSLWAFVQSIEDIEARVEIAINNIKRMIKASDRGEFTARAEKVIRGMTANVEIIKKHCRPVVEYLDGQQPPDDVLAWASIQTGLSPHDMLPYFFQDWFGTPDFDEVKALFCNAVLDHCSDRESVAVLGAGACGLLYRLAQHFSLSLGVDLCLPSLLMAKHLMSGDSLTFYLANAEWREIALGAPLPPTNDIRFTVANVMRLPFHDSSISVITTQGLLDIIANPSALAREIHRVLKADGIWINYSPSFWMPGEPIELGSPKLSELPPILEQWGYACIRKEAQRFKELNVEKLCPSAPIHDWEVHFFIAKKLNQSVESQIFKPLGRSVFARDSFLWKETPKIVVGRELTIMNKKVFTHNGIYETTELSVLEYTFSVPHARAKFLEMLFSYVDGRKTLNDIYNALCTEGISISKDEFLDLIYCLNVDHYLIALQVAVPYRSSIIAHKDDDIVR